MKRFVAWARVSSKRQEKEGWSLGDQDAKLTAFAARLDGTILKLFSVAETASKRNERKAFNDFLAFVKKNRGRLDGMLFASIDRAARNLEDWTALEGLERETGVGMCFPDIPRGDTPAAKLQRRVMLTVAAHTADDMAVRIRGGQQRRAESGMPFGRPYGYRNVRINGRGRIEPDPLAAPKLKLIFELFAGLPLTIDSLVAELARRGVAYTDRTPKFPRTVLHRILHNRVYIGEVLHDKAWRAGSFEPLVDRVTFKAVQDKFSGPTVYHAPELTYAGGLVVCGHCGRVVTGEEKRKKSPLGETRTYVYYRCSGYNATGHPRTRLTEAQVDQQVLRLFDDIRLDDDERAWFVDVIRARAQAAQAESQKLGADWNRRHAQVKARLDALLEMRMNQEIDAETYTNKFAALKDEQAGLRLKLEALQLSDGEAADLSVKAFELSQSLKERWLTADYKAKRTVFSILLKTVRLNCGNLEFSLRKPFDLLKRGKLIPLSGAMGI